MFTHSMQHEKRQPVPVGEIDRSPALLDLYLRDELTAATANILIGIACARTLGFASRLGRRRLLSMPGVGRRTVDELERVAGHHGLELRP